MYVIPHCIFGVLLLVLSTSGVRDQTSKRYPLIVVSSDGLGWQFVSGNLTDTPNFDYLAETGVWAKNMLTVNPTTTFPTHTTFVTGLWPESHGIVANDFYDPLYDETFHIETDCTNFDPKFYNESEPIWLTMEKRGRKSATYFWPSSTSYERRPSFFADHFDWFNDPYWNRIETAIKWLKSEQPPELLLLYFEQTDYDGHKYGPNSKEYLRSVETTDRHAVGYLITQLRMNGLLEKVNLMVLSDHGMVETSSERQIDVFRYVSSHLYHEPGMWVKPELVGSVYKELQGIPHAKVSRVTVYLRKDVPEEYHSRNNRRYPPLFLDVEMGWSERYEWYSKYHEGTWTRGNHGWAPNEELAALFYARGPSFKEGYYANRSLRAVDLYPLMCHLLDMEPLPNNGSLDNMMDLLREPEPETVTEQPIER
ncbi:predicted protein, partial [Nematostella vectensis]